MGCAVPYRIIVRYASSPERTSRLSAAERRERILGAATEVFAEQGYEAAAVSEIAGRAGVVASVIYDHFGSKRELHIELLERHGQALIERSIEQVTAGDPLSLLRASIDAFYRFVEEDPFLWRFLFRDPPSDPEIAAAHRGVHERATAGIAELARRSTPDSETILGVPAEQAISMVAKISQEANQGLAEWWWEHPDVPREQVVDLLVAVLWNGLAAVASGSPSATDRSEPKRPPRRGSAAARSSSKR